jgi:hypothetical protein
MLNLPPGNLPPGTVPSEWFVMMGGSTSAQNGNSIMISGTPIGKILSPANIPSVSLPHSYDVMRSNLQILNRFRELYYTLKYKNQFRQWLWIKVRLPRIEQAHHPDRLQEALEQEGGEEADLEAVLQSLG